MITVDIWSDVRCPFCYIGKRHFEMALRNFEHKEDVQVEWHSFQLDPNLETQPEVPTLEHFTRVKNISLEQAKQMMAGARKMGEAAGLHLQLENTVVANSFRSHQLIQLAKEKGLGNEIEEALFKAHFSEERNIDDEDTLATIADGIGLSSVKVKEALKNQSYAYAVKQDEMQAANIGVRGVPFFVFNNKYAVSGAQPAATFLEVLQRVAQEQNT